MNESEDTEEIKHSPSTHTCCKDSRPCPTVSQYQLDALQILLAGKCRGGCLYYAHAIFNGGWGVKRVGVGGI